MVAGEFHRLLVSHSEFLKPFAITLTRDQEWANDLFQETLCRAMLNREKYHEGTNIRAWLYTIMRNIFINTYRRKMRQRFVEARPHEWIEANTSLVAPDPESILQAKQIMGSVHRLPEIFRYPFLLYFEGMRYGEISELLKEPLGTIKSRIHFARKMLKKEIRRE